MTWNKEELKIIKQVFDWTDSDGDGSVSLEDLMTAMDIQNKSYGKNLFSRLKGSDSSETPVTYESFCINIAKVPEVIKKCMVECKKPETETNSQHSSEDQPIESLKDPLIQSIRFLLRYANHVIEVLGNETVFCCLNTIEILVNDLNSLVPLEINMALKAMASALRRSLEIHDSMQASLSNQLCESTLAYENLKIYADKLHEQKECILTELKEMKSLNQRSEIERVHARQVVFGREGKESKEELYSIHTEIANKEHKLNKLQSELMKLNSRKTIQEIRENNGLDSNHIKELKRAKTNRKSCSAKSPSSNSNQNSNKTDPEFRVKYLTSQLENKQQTINRLNSDINELGRETQRLAQQLNQSNSEKQRLYLKLEEAKKTNFSLLREYEKMSVISGVNLSGKLKELELKGTSNINERKEEGTQCTLLEDCPCLLDLRLTHIPQDRDNCCKIF